MKQTHCKYKKLENAFRVAKPLTLLFSLNEYLFHNMKRKCPHPLEWIWLTVRTYSEHSQIFHYSLDLTICLIGIICLSSVFIKRADSVACLYSHPQIIKTCEMKRVRGGTTISYQSFKQNMNFRLSPETLPVEIKSNSTT